MSEAEQQETEVNEASRLVRVVHEAIRTIVAGLARAVEPLDRGSVESAIDPLVSRPEAELRDLRSSLDGIDGLEELVDVDPVHVSLA